MIVILVKNPLSPLLGFFTPLNKNVNIVGTNRSPTPNDRAAATINRLRRVHWIYDRTRRPDAITLAKRNVVTPPRTGFGTDVK